MKYLVAAAAFLAGTAFAAGFPAGTYVTEGGQGTLKLRAAQGERQPFAIDSVGANAHVCEIAGTVRNGLAVVPTTEGQPACRVRFLPRGNALEVSVGSADLEACRQFCGARASFDGTYLPLPAACEAAPMDKRFRAAYRARQYAQAHAVLDAFVRDCAGFTERFALAGLRNDLAITRFHLGDPAGCRAALEPLREFMGARDEALKEQYPPAEADAAMAVAQAARFNWRKCAPR